MNTDGKRYVLVYPDGRVTEPLGYEERRTLLEAAPVGTRWCLLDGTVLAVVRGTMEQYWAQVTKLDAQSRARAA